MKTIAFLICIVTLQAAPAADIQAGRHYVGFQGGWNSSTLSEDEHSSIESTDNYTFGVVGMFSLTPWLAFQPEAMYTAKGATGKATFGTSSYATVEGSVELKYLEIPLLLRFMYPNDHNIVPHLLAGTAVAANLTANADGIWGTRQVRGDIQEVVTDGDLAFVLGGGVGFGLSALMISLDFRYTHGLLPVDNTSRLTELKNRTWTVSAALMFKVGEGKE